MTKSIFTDAYKSLLNLLVETRIAAGLHQTELAERINWDQTKISNVERGIRRLDAIEFHVIARALGADPIELFAELSRRLPERIDI